MNTRSLTRLGLIMALFALLLAVSAVAAQDSQPGIPIAPIDEDGPIVVQPGAPRAPLPPKAAPGVYEPGETASPAANKTESEPNNTFATADLMAVGDVMSGKIKPAGDIDYFRINVPPGTFRKVLIDVDASVNDSALDAVMCLFNAQFEQLGCSDDSDWYDPLLYMEIWGTVYITVNEFHHGVEGGDGYIYKLLVYPPLLVSATTDGNVAGIAFQKSDILAHYDFTGGVEKWMLFFDGSDVGLTQNVNSFLVWDPYSFELTLQGSQRLSEVGTVTPYDILLFGPSSLGPTTDGEFRYDLRGKGEGLTTSTEKIDALAWGGYCMGISTVGTAVVTAYGQTVTAQDEDMLGSECEGTQPHLTGDLAFDGSLVPGLGGEDVTAASGNGRYLYVTIEGSGIVGGKSVNQKDIFIVDRNTNTVPSIYWRGSQHHFPYNLDAVDVP